MKLIGWPFGYVVWGVIVGTALGVTSCKLTSPDFPIDVPIGAVLGGLLGYGIERLSAHPK
jgi:hypothetical protein